MFGKKNAGAYLDKNGVVHVVKKNRGIGEGLARLGGKAIVGVAKGGVGVTKFAAKEVKKAVKNEMKKSIKKAARDAIPMVVGMGDYEVIGNSIEKHSMIVGDAQQDFIPSFSSDARHVRVRHREFLGNVMSAPVAGAFRNTMYRINPGIVTTFPWLSGTAKQYDQWYPEGIVVSFSSTSSSFNGTDQSLGQVILATDYDLTDTPYNSSIEALNAEFSVSCKASESVRHPIECAPLERQVRVLKVRGVTNPTDNLQWYDLCNLQVCTEGVSAPNIVLGQLWISYDIVFLKEQLNGNLYGASLLQTDSIGTTGISTSAYFGTNFAVTSSSTLVPTFGTNTITFPSNVGAGSFLVSYYVEGTSTAVAQPAVAFTTGCSAGPLSIGPFNIVSYNSTSTFLQRSFTVTINSPNAVITFSGGTLPTSPTLVFCTIVQLNSTVV